jgi:pimeloyl-ACP methyl ester carboxylesterase
MPIFRIAILAVTLLGAALYAPTPRTDSMYLRPGRLIGVDGHRMNIYCAGSGSPTVVFDSGLEDWAPAWDTIQPVIARTTRTCTYDRAGNGFSDPGPMPRTAQRIAGELHELLKNAGERGPFVLVGHSFGGINVRIYADRYRRDVAGLVLDDASAETQVLYMNARERRQNDAEILHAQQMLYHCMYLAEAHFRTASPKQKHECPGTFFRGLPDPKDFPGPLDGTLMYESERPKQYAASAAEFANFTTAGMRALLPEQRTYGSMPLRILVAYHHHMSAKDEALWQQLHRRWLHLSTDAKYIAAVKSGHYIQFDQPNLVVDAIREVVATARKHYM